MAIDKDDDPKLQKLDEELKKARGEFEEDYNPKAEINEGLNDGARAGIELVGALLGGALLGYGADHMFDTSPIFFFVGILLGVITGFYSIYKITMNVGTSVGFKGLKADKKTGKQSLNSYDDDDEY